MIAPFVVGKVMIPGQLLIGGAVNAPGLTWVDIQFQYIYINTYVCVCMRLACHSTKLRFSVYHFLIYISATPMGQPKYISAHHGAPFASKMRAAPWPPQAFTGWEKTLPSLEVWKDTR